MRVAMLRVEESSCSACTTDEHRPLARSRASGTTCSAWREQHGESAWREEVNNTGKYRKHWPCPSALHLHIVHL